MINDKKHIMERIQKCFALSKSPNEHEAAAALKKAHELMEDYNISEADVKLADVSVANSSTKSGVKAPKWVSSLIGCVGDAFNCGTAYGTRYKISRLRTSIYGEVEFIGIGINPELAKFAFDVLYRQLAEARMTFIKKYINKNTSRQRKTQRADLFCYAWVDAVRQKVNEFAKYKKPEVVTQYMDLHYGDSITTIDRFDTQSLNKRDIKDIVLGQAAGEKVQLNHGVMRDDFGQIE